MTSMRTGVLHVIPSLHLGGAEKTLVELLTDPDARENAIVAVMAGGGPLEAKVAAIGVPVLDLQVTGPLTTIGAAWRLARLIRERRPEIVQSWLYYADILSAFALVLSGLRRQVSLCWGVRCSDHRPREYPLRLRVAIGLCRWLSGLPDLIVFNSNAGMVSHMARGYKPRRAKIVENGIDSDRFDIGGGVRERVRRGFGWGEDEIVIAMVGRNDAQKGFDVFVKLAERFPSVHAMAVGKETEALQGSPNLRCLGVRDDVPELLAAADIVVSCSHYGEGFLNVVAEGMAAGKPVICTAVGDAERIAGEAAVVVPPGNFEVLAEALSKMIADPAGRKALGMAARDRIRSEFPIKRMTSSFARSYEELRALR